MTTVAPFKISAWLETERDMAEYFAAAWQSGNPEAVIAALGDIVQARGLGKLAEKIQMDKESIYAALRPGSQTQFDKIYLIIRGLGLNPYAACEYAAS